MAARTRIIALLVLVTFCVGCDQASKSYASKHLKFAPPQSYAGDTLRIQYAENTGAFLSLAGDLSRETRFWLLTICNGIVLAGVAAYLLVAKDIDRLSFAALALIFAGGIGNLIDRVMLDGVVVDFLNLGLGNQTLFGIPLRTGIFNVADIAITAGFFLLLPKMFQGDSDSAKTKATPPQETATA